MIHLSWLDYALWAADFSLACLGAQLTFTRHRSIWPLWLLLGYWAIGDVVGFVLHFGSLRLYAVAYFAKDLPLFALEFAFAAMLCAMVLKERLAMATWYASAFGLTAPLGLLWGWSSLRVSSVLAAEIVACGVMAIMLGLAWLGACELFNRELARPWPGLVLGTVVLLAVQALAFGLKLHYRAAAWTGSIRPAGELLALGMWSWSVRSWSVVAEVRLPLSSKKPPTSVGSVEILKTYGVA